LSLDMSSPCLGREVGVFVFDKGADKPEVVAGGGEDAMAPFGVPTGDTVLEFGRTVEMDFLRALTVQSLRMRLQRGGGVALDGGCVGAAALVGARDNTGVVAE
jgi:hypothetical protein